jgi:hypothetical protein
MLTPREQGFGEAWPQTGIDRHKNRAGGVKQMSDRSLRAFVAHATDAGRIGSEDVQDLQRNVLPDGVMSREDADLLIALDRSVSDKDPAWAEFLIEAVVAFTVWTTRPTGYVDAETARWLTDSLDGGAGATETAKRIAFEVVREAELVDEALLIFVLRAPQHALGRLPNSRSERVA